MLVIKGKNQYGTDATLVINESFYVESIFKGATPEPLKPRNERRAEFEALNTYSRIEDANDGAYKKPLYARLLTDAGWELLGSNVDTRPGKVRYSVKDRDDVCDKEAAFNNQVNAHLNDQEAEYRRALNASMIHSRITVGSREYEFTRTKDSIDKEIENQIKQALNVNVKNIPDY
jgi:hypothetical protein